MSERVRIYSAQHGAYWRPNGHGYTTDPEEAWIITREEAERITDHCGPEKQIELWPVVEGWKTRKELEQENERLRAAIEAAPHLSNCQYVCTWGPYPCNCWKQAALAGKEQGNA